MIKKSINIVFIKLLSAILGIYNIKIVTTSLDIIESGKYFFLLSIFTFLLPLMNFGLNIYTLKRVSSEINLNKSKEIIQNNILVSFICSSILILMLYTIVKLTNYEIENINDFSFLYMFASIPLFSSGLIVCNAFLGLGKPYINVLYSGILFNLCLFFQYMFMLPSNIDDFIKIYFYSSLIFFLISLSHFMINYGYVKFSPNIKVILNAKYFLFIAFLGVLYSSVSQFLLGFSDSYYILAVLAVSLKLTNIFSMILGAVNNLFSKIFSNSHFNCDGLLSSHSKKASITLYIIAFPPLVLSLLFSEYILSIFNPEFIEYSWIFKIILLSQFFNILTGTTSYLLMMTGNEKTHFFNTTLSHVISIFCGLVITSFNPAYGSLSIIFLSQIMVNFLSWRACIKLLNINTLSIINFKK